MKQVNLYCDGSCYGNPGLGGYGVILEYGQNRKELHGHIPQATNNSAELTAAIQGFRALTERCQVNVITDSAYIVNSFSKGWIYRWHENGWKTAEKKPVANRQLWEELLAEVAKHDVSWTHVRGHNGNPYNERCDELARMGTENR